MKDYYALLEIEFGATEEEIRKAYRRLVKEYHPDHNDDPQAARKFIEITEAYETLTDPVRRREYDRQYLQMLKQKALVKSGQSHHNTTPPPPGGSSVNAEKAGREKVEDANERNGNTVMALLILVAIMSFIGIASLPYGYYTLLRIVVFVAAGILAIYDLDRKSTAFFIISALVALIFNPIIPLYLDKGTWQVLDFLSGVYMLVRAFGLKK